MRISAGELSRKALADTTKYDALEVGHAMADGIPYQLELCLENHLNIKGEEGDYPWRQLPEFCVVMQIAEDPIIKNLKRRKFYCCPFLPEPRPNQSVFYYDRSLDKVTKRLWILPPDIVMAELASLFCVDDRYKTQQAWSIAWFEHKFWEYIRYESGITLLSQHEFLLKHRKELIEAGCKLLEPDYTNPFDFDKISIEKVIDTQEALVS